eukprot:TRINITY_DN17705_c0_g1_i1.p1 TRINITY_DN17705_c0_g1~~TRINITY_DN17705_c0_g1_i1.p1  ORF type:complete len:957 (-),score=180.66 TRINITY_DN17705_c0_g1_i1:95-2587(-)
MASVRPPQRGWRFPWNGPVRQAFAVISSDERRKEAAEVENERLSTEVANVEGEAQQLVDQAEMLLSMITPTDTAPPEGLADTEKVLSMKVVALGKFLREASTLNRQNNGKYQRLVDTIKASHSKFSSDFASLRGRRHEAESSASANSEQRRLDERDMTLLDNLKEAVDTRIDAAVELVDGVSIAADAMYACHEDEEAMRHAVEKTETMALEAQAAVRDAEFRLRAQKRELPEDAGEQLTSEFKRVEARLESATQKLEVAKGARRVWEQRGSAAMIAKEVGDKLALAEVEADRVSALVAVFAPDQNNDGLVVNLTEAQDAVASLETLLNEVERLQGTRLVDAKRKNGNADSSRFLDEAFKRLEPRLDALRLKVSESRIALKDYERNKAIQTIESEVAEKLQAAQVLVEGFEQGSGAEGIEAHMSKAHAAIASSRVFLKMKLLEARRLAKDTSADSASSALVRTITEAQSRVESLTQQLHDCKSKLAVKRWHAVETAVEDAVAHAEGLVAAARMSSENASDGSSLELASEQDLRATCNEFMMAERAANEAVTQARSLIGAKQIEAKRQFSSGKATGNDTLEEALRKLKALEERVSSARTELMTLRRNTGLIEQRLAAKKLLEDVNKKCAEADNAASAVEAAGMEEDAAAAAAAQASAQSAALTANAECRALVRQLEQHMSYQPMLKDVLGKALEQVKAVQARLANARATLLKDKEKRLLVDVKSELETKASDCVSKMAKATAIDKDLSCLQTGKTLAMLVDFERALLEANCSFNACKSFLAMKRLSLRSLSDETRVAVAARLDAAGARVETAGEGLEKMQERCREWKDSLST